MTRPSRFAVASLITVIAVLLAAAPASAHVTVNPGEAEQGGFAKLTFRVPNERDDASTTTLSVQLPADHPLAFVSLRPTPGWTYTVERAPLPTPIEMEGEQITEAVRTITWTGGPVGPGEFQEFDVSVGPLPEDVDSLSFPAVQTYSSGEVVRWIEASEPRQEEPEHPAPVLQLTADEEEDGAEAGGSTTTEALASVSGEAASAADDDDSDDGGTDALAVVALIVGAVGLLTGIGAMAMARRR